MLYMVTFTINIPQMLAYIPYIDPMGEGKHTASPPEAPRGCPRDPARDHQGPPVEDLRQCREERDAATRRRGGKTSSAIFLGETGGEKWKSHENHGMVTEF
jgi:hypothetical protein